jgi:hypothetical protein
LSIVLDKKPKDDVKPLIEGCNYRSYRAFIDAGFGNDIPRSVEAPYKQEEDFFSQVSLDKGPITRKITKMIRQKVDGKEYLTFTENWTALNWLGVDIENPITDRLEGILRVPKVVPVTDEKAQRIGKRRSGIITKYEIPFNKENVDKWLEITGTPKEEIKYTVSTPNRSDECAVYEQFLYPWNQAVDTLMKDGGFEADYIDRLKDKKDTSQQTKK